MRGFETATIAGDRRSERVCVSCTECSNLSLRDIWSLLSFVSIRALPPPNLLSKRLLMHPSLAVRESITEYMDSFECLNARQRRSMADICNALTSKQGGKSVEIGCILPLGLALIQRLLSPGSSGTARKSENGRWKTNGKQTASPPDCNPTCISFDVMDGDSNPRKGLVDGGRDVAVETDGSDDGLVGEGGPSMRHVCRMEWACAEPSAAALYWIPV